MKGWWSSSPLIIDQWQHSKCMFTYACKWIRGYEMHIHTYHCPDGQSNAPPFPATQLRSPRCSPSGLLMGKLKLVSYKAHLNFFWVVSFWFTCIPLGQCCGSQNPFCSFSTPRWGFVCVSSECWDRDACICLELLCCLLPLWSLTLLWTFTAAWLVSSGYVPHWMVKWVVQPLHSTGLCAFLRLVCDSCQ